MTNQFKVKTNLRAGAGKSCADFQEDFDMFESLYMDAKRTGNGTVAQTYFDKMQSVQSAATSAGCSLD